MGEWSESRPVPDLTPEKLPSVPIVRETEWTPEVRTRRLEEGSYYLYRGSNLDCPFVQSLDLN
jgi:hypothetical protein